VIAVNVQDDDMRETPMVKFGSIDPNPVLTNIVTMKTNSISYWTMSLAKITEGGFTWNMKFDFYKGSDHYFQTFAEDINGLEMDSQYPFIYVPRVIWSGIRTTVNSHLSEDSFAAIQTAANSTDLAQIGPTI